jgi:hypothetical protein
MLARADPSSKCVIHVLASKDNSCLENSGWRKFHDSSFPTDFDESQHSTTKSSFADIHERWAVNHEPWTMNCDPCRSTGLKCRIRSSYGWRPFGNLSMTQAWTDSRRKSRVEPLFLGCQSLSNPRQAPIKLPSNYYQTPIKLPPKLPPNCHKLTYPQTLT